MDDDLGRQGDVEVGRGDGGGVKIIQHLGCLVIPSVNTHFIHDILWAPSEAQGVKMCVCSFSPNLSRALIFIIGLS